MLPRYSMNQLFNEFLLLEREVASGGQTMDVELGRQVDIFLSPCLPYMKNPISTCHMCTFGR